MSYSNRGSHVVGADFSKVPAHDAVVQAVKQHDDANIHGVLRLDPAKFPLKKRMSCFWVI